MPALILGEFLQHFKKVGAYGECVCVYDQCGGRPAYASSFNNSIISVSVMLLFIILAILRFTFFTYYLLMVFHFAPCPQWYEGPSRYARRIRWPDCARGTGVNLDDRYMEEQCTQC
jgi:hypothetical protein